MLPTITLAHRNSIKYFFVGTMPLKKIFSKYFVFCLYVIKRYILLKIYVRVAQVSGYFFSIKKKKD